MEIQVRPKSISDYERVTQNFEQFLKKTHQALKKLAKNAKKVQAGYVLEYAKDGQSVWIVFASVNSKTNFNFEN